MKRWNFTIWAGLFFLVVGIANAVIEEFLAAASSLALGMSLVLIQPPMTTGTTEETTERSGDKGRIWGIPLTPRNIAALVLLAVAVVTFMAVVWDDFS